VPVLVTHQHALKIPVIWYVGRIFQICELCFRDYYSLVVMLIVDLDVVWLDIYHLLDLYPVNRPLSLVSLTQMHNIPPMQFGQSHQTILENPLYISIGNAFPY